MGKYTVPRSTFLPDSSSVRLSYAKISAWCIRNMSNGERLVAEGIFCKLAVGESTIATSAEIAGWANVSEATVSRALRGLAAKGLIALSRVYYSETGRTRWSLRHLPAQPNGSYAPGRVGSDIDDSPAQSVSPDSGVPTTRLGAITDSAAEHRTSTIDPPTFYDSDSPNKHACMHASGDAEEPNKPNKLNKLNQRGSVAKHKL